MTTHHDDLNITKNMVINHLRGTNARIYLFGSRAEGSHGPTSDIDIAIDPVSPLPLGLLSELRELLDESSILFRVDIVDLSQTSATLAEQIRKKGKLWTN